MRGNVMKLTYGNLKRIIKNEIKFLHENAEMEAEGWKTDHIPILTEVLKAFNELSKDIKESYSIGILQKYKDFLQKNKYVWLQTDLFSNFLKTKDQKDFEKLKQEVVPQVQEAMQNLLAE